MRISAFLAAGIALGALTTASPAGQGIYRSTGTFGNHRGVDLTFATVVDALLGGTVTSAPATFHGSSSPTPAKMQGGEIRICTTDDCSSAGPWRTEADVADGTIVQVRVPGPSEPFGYSVAAVQVMGAVATFEVQGRGPASLTAFASSTVDPDRTIESGTSTFRGWASAPVSVRGGEYRICPASSVCGAFAATDGVVSDGDQIQLRTVSGGFSQSRRVEIDVAGKTHSWTVTTRPRDATPDAFSFASSVDVDPGVETVSEAVALTGHDGVDVSVDGGSYRLCPTSDCPAGGEFSTGTTANVPAGTFVRLRVVSPDFGLSRRVSLTAGTTTAAYEVRTRQIVETPQAGALDESIVDLFDVEPRSSIVSAPGVLQGFDYAAISVSGGEYSLNDGPFVSSDGIARDGDRVVLRQTSGDFSRTTSTTLRIGGLTRTWSATVRDKDARPDAFVLGSATDRDPGTQVTSAPTPLSGFDDAAISVTGGEYSIGDGPFTASTGVVRAGDTVRVRLTTSTVHGETRTARLTVGDVVGDFVATTRAKDTTPDAFAFAPAADVEPGTAATSGIATLAGFDDASVSISGGDATYSLAGGPFGTTSGVARPGDTIQVRLTAGGYGETRTATLTVGGTSATYTVSSLTRDTTPDAFAFAPQSGLAAGATAISSIARLTGHDGVDVSVTGGGYQICTTSNCSDQGTTFVSTTTTNVPAGRYVRVRLTTGALGTTTSAVLTAGTARVAFDATTRARDTVPNAFSLGGPVAGLEPGSISTSTSATLSGFDDGPISVTGPGAEYAVNGGAFGVDPGTVASGDRVQVRVTVGSFGETRTATLDVGGTRASYSATARAKDTTPNAFSFTAVSNAQPVVLATSAPVVLNGHDGVDVSVTGGEYQICSSSTCGSAGEWTSEPTADVANGSWVRLRTTTADLGGRSSVVLTAGTASATWTATTRAGASCTTPWGSTIAHGRSVVAYQVEKATAISQCSATQTRECDDGTLSGTSTYRYASCGVPKNVSVTCTSKVGNTQTITASDYNQDPLTARNPTNGGTWVVFRDGPYLNCLDMTNGNLDFSSSSICRQYNGGSFTGGTNLRNCSWR